MMMIILGPTTCTHSMSGSRTAWFPDRLTTQAGVSGVASSSAITASTPILLPCRAHIPSHQSHASYYSGSVSFLSIVMCCWVPQPGFCQRPRAFLLSGRGRGRWRGCQSPVCQSPAGELSKSTLLVWDSVPSVYTNAKPEQQWDAKSCLFDLLGRDGHALPGQCALSHDDHIQTTTSGPLLREQKEIKCMK